MCAVLVVITRSIMSGRKIYGGYVLNKMLNNEITVFNLYILQACLQIYIGLSPAMARIALFAGVIPIPTPLAQIRVEPQIFKIIVL